MPIKFNCHKCGANLRVPERHIGKKARCPKCDEKCVVPEMSQRSNAMGASFDEIGDLLDPSAGMAPPPPTPVAPAVPHAIPAPASHASSPMALPSSAPNNPVASPYAAPLPRAGGASLSGSVVQPLYEARNMIKIHGWFMFVLGILYCLTIVYAIIGWLPIWMGWQVKGAAEALTVGVETGDQAQIHLACQRLATYFKIMGVLTIIGLVMMALALVFVFIFVVFGAAGSAGGGF